MSSTSQRIEKLSPQKLALLQQVMGESAAIAEPIAVVGMSCRFAGASSVEEYWRLIQDGSDMTGEIPASRWDVEAFFDPSGTVPGKMRTRWGGFLDDIDQFDATFFGISPREAEKMDPQHRLLLEVVWEALEYGGLSPEKLRQSATGVFVGVGGVDYSRIPIQLENYFEQITAYSGTGNALSIAANRISYTLDLRGPSLAIDTACSSSLVATHLAIRSLREKECDTAIVGGVNAILTPETTLAFSQAQMLSPDGKCRPFDDRANGYVRGEGCGVVVLKRLSDAVSAGDIILATIRGSAVNQDGLTSGITAPRGTSQVSVIKQALRDARRNPRDVSYIEAHGTATPLGDPIELQALAEVFRNDATGEGAGEEVDGGDAGPCYVGSVKANIGHSETSAGMASLIKAILMLKHRTIPKQPHFENLNRHVDLSGSRLRIARGQMAWDTTTKTLMAGVSSFGFGGTNAHVVLEAAATQSPDPEPEDRPAHVCTLSAKSADRLCDLAGRISSAIAEHDDYRLADICHTTAVGRSHFNHRLAIPTRDRHELKEALDAVAAGQVSHRVKRGKARGDSRLNVAFLFAGQGAQYPQMGHQLFKTHRVFREALERCDEILADLLPRRLIEVIFEDRSDESLLHQTQYTQPALFAIEYSLSQLWRSFGIEPTVMIGHSVGDYVAACEAGVFSLADGLTLIAHRGRLVQGLPLNGAMAVVFADRDQVADVVLPYDRDVSIAADNGSQNVVISGRADVVSDLLKQFESAGIKTRALEVSHAMHSPLLEPILDEFERRAGQVTYHAPRIPLISSRDGKRIGDRIRDPGYWRDHLRNTVCFADGVRALQEFPLDAAVEIGPGSTLCSMASRVWDGHQISWLPSMRPGREDWDVLTETLAELYVRGAKVDWSSFDQPWVRKRQILPTYPFEAQSFWYDMSRRQTHHVSPHTAVSGDVHPLLGRRVAVAGDKTVFEVTLDTNHPRYLADHCLDRSPVVPAAAYIEQGMAAAASVFGEGHHAVSDLSIQQAMVLADQQSRYVQVHVGPELRGQCTFEVHSRPVSVDVDSGQSWTLHASGTLQHRGTADSNPEPIELDDVTAGMSDGIGSEPFYRRMANCGLEYGPLFQVLTELRKSGGECVARLELDDALQQELATHTLHPVVLDGCLQSIAGVLAELDTESDSDLILPTFVQQVRVYRDVSPGSYWIHTRLTDSQSETDTFTTDIDLYDGDGRKVAELVGVRVQRISKQRPSRSDQVANLLYQLRWRPSPRIPSEAAKDRSADQWLLFADSTGVAVDVAKQLMDSGDAVSVVYPGSAFERRASGPIEGCPTYQLDPLRLADYEQLLAAIAEDASQDCRVVDFWGIDGCSLDSNKTADEGERAAAVCGHALLMLRALARSKTVNTTRTVLLTQGGCAVGEQDEVSPACASLWGLGRTAMVEMPRLSCRMLDLDPAGAASASELVDELTSDTMDDHVALRDSERFTARLETVADGLQTTRQDGGQTIPAAERFSLRVGASGGLDGLRYVPIGQARLGSNEVELEVKSTGLNFSDVLKGLGLYPGVKDEIVPLGIECAGVVSRVGDAVERFSVGQRVMGVAPYSFASHAITAEYALVVTPDNLSDDQASTIPITFLTAHHALCTLARLAKGEKVLIHAGAGGVGQAAIQIAQAIGAEIFATAGSDHKRDFLRSLGVRHVMDSRSLAFADEITDITSGEGVDVVLNSLPGEAINKSLSILSAYGRFLEIGKTDIYQNRRIGLWPFQDNLSYFAIDLDRMLRQRPDEIRRLYREVMPLFEQGVYHPLPLKAFPPEAVVDAFRYMAQRKNIGKVVVSMADRRLKSADTMDRPSAFGASGSVLITGGLGALGQQVAGWVASKGGMFIVMLTRRSPDEAVQSKLADLRAAGVSVAVIQGDVCDRNSLADALSTIPSSFPPIRGVVHAAGVLSDGVIQTMDLPQLNKAMDPKTRGAWNLHRVLTDPLDFFVLFSSAAGVMGSPGQANYAAGNCFLDGLARLRHRHGQPATSIAWGPWDEAGMAARDDVRRQLNERGMSPLAPETAIDILDRAIEAGTANLAVMDVDWGVLLGKLPGGGSTLFSSLRTDDASTAKQQNQSLRDTQLFQRLNALSPSERTAELESIIAATVGGVLGIEAASIDVDQPLASLGLDSLMGMELRSSLEAKLGIEIPVSSLFDDPSVTSLAGNASQSFDNADVEESSAAVNRNNDRAVSTHEPRLKSALVSLSGAHGGRTPLFCVHPVGGDLRCYDSVARSLLDRPVYGLRAHGLHAGSRAHGSIDEMISDYIRTIRNAQPDGPYCLMGWSTGGIFAYEIARRFHQEHLPVQSLVMVDTPLPAVFDNVDLDDDAKFLVDLVEFANYFAGTSMEISYEALREQSEEQALSDVLGLAVKHGVLPATTTKEYLHRLITVCKRHVELLQAYKPPRCDMPVHLVRPLDTGMLIEATGQSQADDLGWGDLVQLQTHQVPGHHFTMMTAGNAAVLAEKLDELLGETTLVGRTLDEL